MLIDISLPLSDELAVYPGNPPYQMQRTLSLDAKSSANVSAISLGSHTGTHLDAPLHSIREGASITDVPLDAFCGIARVLDLTGLPNDITKAALLPYGISQGERIILKTRNTLLFDGRNCLREYAGLTYDAAEYLADKQISLVGIDYLTIEVPRPRRTTGKSAHLPLLEAKVAILEGVDLSAVSPGIYELICLPLKLTGCDGSPVRAVLRTIDERESSNG
jgi:arylformamidase